MVGRDVRAGAAADTDGQGRLAVSVLDTAGRIGARHRRPYRCSTPPAVSVLDTAGRIGARHRGVRQNVRTTPCLEREGDWTCTTSVSRSEPMSCSASGPWPSWMVRKEPAPSRPGRAMPSRSSSSRRRSNWPCGTVSPVGCAKSTCPGPRRPNRWQRSLGHVTGPMVARPARRRRPRPARRRHGSTRGGPTRASRWASPLRQRRSWWWCSSGATAPAGRGRGSRPTISCGTGCTSCCFPLPSGCFPCGCVIPSTWAGLES